MYRHTLVTSEPPTIIDHRTSNLLNAFRGSNYSLLKRGEYWICVINNKISQFRNVSGRNVIDATSLSCVNDRKTANVDSRRGNTRTTAKDQISGTATTSRWMNKDLYKILNKYQFVVKILSDRLEIRRQVKQVRTRFSWWPRYTMGDSLWEQLRDIVGDNDKSIGRNQVLMLNWWGRLRDRQELSM